MMKNRPSRRARRASRAGTRRRRGRDTRDRILDAAERLFARRGVDAVSVRSVLAAARLNVSLVHYHFGGRAGLLAALLRRRLGPITEERRRRLAEVEAGGRGATIEDVLRAWYEYPPPAWLEEHPLPGRVLGQLQLSPSPRVRAIVRDVVRDAFAPLGAALAARLPPGVDPVRGICRIYFVLGVWGIAATGFEDVRRSARKRLGAAAVADARTVVDEVVRFCAAGMRAPGVEEQG